MSPPATSGIPAPSGTDAGSRGGREYSDPAAHASVPPARTSGAGKLTAADPLPTSAVTPPTPSSSPASVAADGRPIRDHSNAVSQSGEVAESSAAMPDVSRSSAHASAPYVHAIMRPPATAA